MTENFFTTKDLAKSTSSLLPDNNTGIYAQDIASQQKELQKLFTQSYFNNGETSRAELQPEIDRLTNKINELKTRLENLQAKADANKAKVAEKAQEMKDLLYKIDQANDKILVGQEDNLDAAVFSAIKDLKSGQISQGGLHNRIMYYFNTAGSISSQESAVKALFGEYEATQRSVTNLVNINDLTTESNLIDSQMGATKATLELLQKTQDNMYKSTGSFYNNVDTDTNIPIYSPAKEALIDGYLEKYTSRFSDIDDQSTIATPATSEEKAAYVNTLGTTYGVARTGNDPYTTQNAQLNKFTQALGGENNIIQQMANMGFSRKEILDAVSKTFPSIGIAHQTNGTYTLPYGHDDGSRNTYNLFSNLMNTTAGKPQDPAKTVAGNVQLAELQTALNDGILTKMYADGFSFKEAMYALQKLFPDTNIGYVLGQTTFKVPEGDDNGAKSTYKTLAEQVKTYWGKDVQVGDGTTNNGNGDTIPPKRTDPVGFSVGDTTYEFLATDALQNGKFDGIHEFMGAREEDGIAELKQLADENGIISGDALKDLMILRTDHATGDYGFVSAYDAGIREINLADMLQESKIAGDKDFININDAIKTNTFGVTMDSGAQLIGYQKYESDTYMNTVYGKAQNLNMFSQLSDGTVSGVINSAYTEVTEALAGVRELIEDVKTIEDTTILAQRKVNLQNNVSEAEATLQKRIDEEVEKNKSNNKKQ